MPERRILTVFELAEHLNVHRITIYRLLKSGNLPGFKIGRVWRFDLDEITQWMESGRSSPDGTKASSDMDGRPQVGSKPSMDGHASMDGNRPSHDGVAPKPARGADGQGASRPAPNQNRRAGRPKR